MPKLKTKGTRNQFKIASFRNKYRKRNEQVRLYASETSGLLNSSFLSQKSSVSLSEFRKIQTRERKKRNKILWFDQQVYRDFLFKYIEFVKVTSNLDISEELDYIISRYEVKALEESPATALIFYKKIYGVACRIAASSVFDPPIFTKTNASGEPECLGPLLVLLHGTIDERRAALSTIKVLELVKVRGTYSIDNLITEWEVPNTPVGEHVKVGNYFRRAFQQVNGAQHGIDLERLISSYKKSLSISFPVEERTSRIEDLKKSSVKHFSGRNGPNGPCLSTIVLDYCALIKDDEGKDLLKSIEEFARLTDNQPLLLTIKTFAEDSSITISHDGGSEITPIHSKISIKDEPWGRQRLFAITDWFSHSALRGYRNTLCKWLVAQPQDGTFDQDAVVEQIRLWTINPDSKKEPESTDLTAATDRIPVEVQQEITSAIMNSHIAEQWRRICTARTFSGPNGEKIQYCMGQPMGISSSWESMAVWNHIMCRTANMYVHGSNFDVKRARYGVVGDDVTLQGADVNFIYKFLVSTLQGVGISPLKGYHFDNQRQGNKLPDIDIGTPMITAEFCKRIICSGREITPIPPKEVLTSFDESSQFPELLFALQRRGYPEITVDAVPALTELSKNSKLALLLSTNPLRIAPPFQEAHYRDLSETKPFDSVIWFIPSVSRERLYRLFLKKVKGTVMKTLQRISRSIKLWLDTATSPGEKKVRNWNYTCDAQSCEIKLLIKFAEEKVLKILEGQSAPSFFVSFDSPDGPTEWIDLRNQLKRLQPLFDVADLFGEIDYPKQKKDKLKINNNFLANATAEFIRDYNSL